MRPGLSDNDIPHCKKVRNEILQRAKLVGSHIKEWLQVIEVPSIAYFLNTHSVQRIKARVSFTFDTWTSEAQDPYLSVTGHYISMSDAQKWELRMEQLAFMPVEGNHSGTNITKIITCVIDRYDIRTKVKFFQCLPPSSLK
jgi:lysyl-tRNA synthetase class I